MIALKPQEAALAALCIRAEARQWRDLIRDHGHRMPDAALEAQAARMAEMEALAARLEFRTERSEPLGVAAQCGHGRVIGAHQCPYKADVHDDKTTLCTCCEACEDECGRDV